MRFFLHSEDRVFIYALTGSLIFYLSVALLAQTLKLPERPRDDFKRIPPRLAKLILKPPQPQPRIEAPPVPPEPAPKVEESPKEKEPPAPKTKETPKPTDKPVEEPKPPSPEEIRLRLEQEAKAREKKNREIAMQSGILRLLTQEEKKSQAARETTEDQELQKVLSPVTGLGPTPKPQEEKAQRQGKVISESGGIDDLIAALKETDLSTGGDGPLGLGQRQVAQVESPIEIRSTGGAATRTYESIKEVVDSLTGWIRFIYNRALREDATLSGTITLEFTILPNGEVSDCRVASSTVHHAVLEEQLVNRFLQLKFEPVPEGTNIVVYPITLVPSG